MRPIKKSHLYTRKGDRGKTNIRNGVRVGKGDQRIVMIGTIDELNCSIGVAISSLAVPKDQDLIRSLQKVQSQLFAIGAYLALPIPSESITPVNEKQISELEKLIDCWDQGSAVLHNFILPGGHPAAAWLQLCRSLVRRSERELIKLKTTLNLSQEILKYFNRLSDAFFAVARLVNTRYQRQELIWSPNEKNV